MAPGPVTIAATTVAALMGLCGLPLAWYKLPMPVEIPQADQDPTTPTQHAVEVAEQPLPVMTLHSTVQRSPVSIETALDWPACAESERLSTKLTPDTLVNLSQAAGGELMQSSELAPHRSVDTQTVEAVVSKTQLAPSQLKPSFLTELNAFGKQVWNVLDAWSMGPLARERLSLLLEQWGLQEFHAQLSKVPGVLLIAFAVDIALLPLLLFWKLCSCSRRSPKIAPGSDTPSKAPEGLGLSMRIADLPTPSRADQPNLNVPCALIQQLRPLDFTERWLEEQNPLAKQTPAIETKPVPILDFTQSEDQANCPSSSKEAHRNMEGCGPVNNQTKEEVKLYEI